MSRQTLKKIFQKFEETGDLGVVRGRGRKRILSEIVREVAFDIVERIRFSISASNARAVLRDLSQSKVVFIQDKICATAKRSRSKKRHNFATNFLARISVNNEWPWNTFWSDEAHFTLDGAVNCQNCRI